MNPPPPRPWDTPRLQNNAQVLRGDGAYAGSSGLNGMVRSAPVLPPRPQSGLMGGGYNTYGSYSSYMPYSGYGYGSYGSLPYRSSLYSTPGYGMYGMGAGYPTYTTSPDGDAERRFVQYAEQQSRSTFANIENIVQAVSSFALMLDNTFFAMTSSFRAVLSVAEHFGRLRSVFGHIWYTINIFRLFSWMYRKFLELLGKRAPSSGSSLAWKEATGRVVTEKGAASAVGSNFSTLAFLGLIISTPYLVSKFLPKYEDNSKPETWKSPGIHARAAFSFVATASNEMSLQINEDITLAPTYIQEQMKLVNTGWAFAVSRGGKSGLVPLNYLVLSGGGGGGGSGRVSNAVPIPRDENGKPVPLKSSLKRVSFGENQVMNTDDVDKKLMSSVEVENSGDSNNNMNGDGS